MIFISYMLYLVNDRFDYKCIVGILVEIKLYLFNDLLLSLWGGCKYKVDFWQFFLFVINNCYGIGNNV